MRLKNNLDLKIEAPDPIHIPQCDRMPERRSIRAIPHAASIDRSTDFAHEPDSFHLCARRRFRVLWSGAVFCDVSPGFSSLL
jgi:hypothetical protein